MPTLYNQYIYRNGAWRQTGTSSDSVTYTISLSGNTLTLTGSNGSSSSVTISSGGNEDIFVAEYNVTPYADILAAYNADKAIFVVMSGKVCSLTSYSSTNQRFTFLYPEAGMRANGCSCYLDNNVSTWTTTQSVSSLGNIDANGDITGNGVTIASGDRLVINDESASKLNNSSITFGTDTTKYLANDGTWQDIPADSVTSVNSKTGAVTLTASDVGASATDQKLRTNQTTNGSIYYPVVGNPTNNSETKYYNNDFRFKPATNLTELQLGQVSNGSTKAGQLTLCSGAYYTYLKPPSYSVIDNHKTYTLPNATGTIALTSDIPNISGKQDKPTITTATLTASNWSNGVYSTLQTTYPFATYDIDIAVNGDTITAAQFDAWNAAQIVGSATTNTFKAMGDVPTVDIPIIVKATPK